MSCSRARSGAAAAAAAGAARGRQGLAVIEASRRVLLQTEVLLSGMERLGLEEVYPRACPMVCASIGQHVRHSLDHFDRLLLSLPRAKAGAAAGTARAGAAAAPLPLVRYDERERATAVETELSAGLDAVLECSERLGALDTQALQLPLEVEFLLSGEEGSAQVFCSTGLRELWFVSHHCIHHQAQIKMIACNMLKDRPDELKQLIPKTLGLAPATTLFRHTSHVSPATQSTPL
jgi:hypothetical protein